MAVQKVEEVERRDGANDSVYELAGTCSICGKKVWVCKTHPKRDSSIDNDDVAVFVVGSRGGGEVAEPPMTYCIKHDPTRSMRRSGIKHGDPIPGDVWQPQR